MKKIVTLFFIQLMVVSAYTQITGTVYDENGTEIPGVNVLIQGTTTGVITNANGKYKIIANVGDSLEFSFLGYNTTKILVSQKNQKIDVKLTPFTFDIGELVVLGYSNKAKTEISSAVTVISSERLNDTPTDDIAGLLQGKVAGVQVVENSGAPGSGAEVRIRGISTIKPGNAEPLYVVDGIIGGSFDPNDVESVTILKDAGATGMYGARANKGVIIVTTKSAKTDKPTFELKSSYGYNFADHGNITMMNGQEFYDWSSEMYRDEDTHQIDKIKFYDDYDKALSNYNYNWVDEAFKPAPFQKYYLSTSGKTNKLGYYLSGAYYNEKGTFRNTGFEKINLKAKTVLELNRRVDLKNNINLTASKGTSYDYMDMYYTYLGIPWDNPFNTDGSARYIDRSNAKKLADGTGWWSRDPINPFHTIDNSDHSYKGVAADYDLTLSIKIFDWLTFTSTNRTSFSTNKNHTYYSPVVAGTYSGKGYISEDQAMWFSVLTSDLLRFNKQFGNHTIDGIIGGEMEKGYTESLGLSGTGLSEGFSVPSVASSEYQLWGNNETGLMRSLLFQVNYNYKSTYFLTGSYRVDASSNFPPNNRIAKFPTISASVLLNKLSLLKDVAYLTMLKARSSYGLTGDPDIGASRYMGLFSLSTQYNSNSAAIPYQLANPDLKWERTSQFNVGVDAEFFNRLTLNLDFYNSTTNDLIILAAQPLSQGFENRYENSGYVVNKGIEINLSSVNIKRGDFKFITDFSFAKNTNVLDGINAPITSTVGGVTQIYQNGSEIYTFYLPKWLGVDPDTGGPLWEKIERDTDGNIISREPTSNYSEAEPQEVGSALPDFTGGVSVTLAYKNISLYANGAYQYGNEIYNSTRIFMDNDGHEPYYNNMLPKEDWSRWEKPGDVATHPSMQNNSLSKETSSRYIEDGSFFKIRTVSLQYHLPKSWVNRFNVNDVSIVCTANNLHVFTNFWGQDPEVTLNKLSWSMPGVSDFKYPNNRQFIFSLNVKF